MCLAVILHGLESGPHLGQRTPFTDKRQQSSLRFASFHIQKAITLNKCAFCMSLGEQTPELSENISQREEASMLRGSTWKSPKNGEAAETRGPVESPRTHTLWTAGLGQICARPSARAGVNNRLYNPNHTHRGRNRKEVHNSMYIHT